MIQPYQIFFPLGLVYSIWGALVWPWFVLQYGSSYPVSLHSGLMISGFLLNFATGFLLTAIPRFTGTVAARPSEIVTAFLINLCPFMVVLPALAAVAPVIFHLAAVLTLSFLVVFFARRVLTSTMKVPDNFIFVGAGIGFGLFGGAMLLAYDVGLLPAAVLWPASTLLNQATMLFLILGIGGRLVRALLGWGPPVVQFGEQKGSAMAVSFILCTLLIAGFFVEFFWSIPFGRVIKAIAVSWLAVTSWKIYRFPRIKGQLARWLWVATWGLVVGLWTHALLPSFGMHAFHIVFVSGFGLMTLMIASRVTLAHGGYDLIIEHKSKVILATGILVIVAAFTRVTAPLVAAMYMRHLMYAGLVWVLAVLVWSVGFVPRIFLLKSRSEK
ncbi:MAG: NnrS family protein [Bdellovibrionota bacterium]